MCILVTGASGFVGTALHSTLLSKGYVVRAAVRTLNSPLSVDGLDVVAVGELGGQLDWSKAMLGVDCVVHCAARAHVMREAQVASQVLAGYRAVNVQGALNLASQASILGVKRFVLLSSVKVNGERTVGLTCCSDGSLPNGGSVFTANDAPAPEDGYALSKWEAEQGLWEIASRTGMEVVVVRSPLVYGQNVKGNLARLLALVRSGVPLPLAAVNNRRSFIGLDNLVDLLIRCMDHPKAAGQTLLVSDGQDLSTPEFLRMIASAMGRPARLFPVPDPLLRLAARALGRLNEMERLVESLQVDSTATRELLGWIPPVSVEEGIKRMVMGT